LRNYRFWLGVVVSLLFLFLFLYRTDFSEMGRAFSRANYTFLVPAVLVYFVGVWFRAMRWRYLLMPLKAVPSRRLFPTVVIGYMANDVLPLRAGELVRCYLLGAKEGVSKTAVLATIFVERVFDGLALLFFLALISLFVPFEDWLRDTARVMGLLFVGALVVFSAVASSEKRVQGLANILLPFLPARLREKVIGLLSLFLGGLASLRSPGMLLGVFLTSLLAWLAEAAMYYIIGFSFELGQPFYVYLTTTAVANLAITLPSSQGGIGPFEFFGARTLGLFGVAEGLSMAYILVLHAALLLPVTLLGFVYLWLENMSLSSVVRRENVSGISAAPDALSLPLEGRAKKWGSGGHSVEK